MAATSGLLALNREPWLAVGAILMFVFFRFGSVPLMDQRSLHNRPGYQRVMATTPALMPRLWPRRGD